VSHPASRPLVLLGAGGTAGHLFPAEALAAVLTRRGITVDLATDARASPYQKTFPAREIHIIPSATFRARNPWHLANTIGALGRGVLKAWFVLARLRPAVVVGFGGYPTLPTVTAAYLRGLPTIIHEQNAVMGRANRLLAPIVRAIATSFPDAISGDPAIAAKSTMTGNPVRPAVIEDAGNPYPELDLLGRVNLLIFGGSQGARIMADVVPAAIERLQPGMRARLAVVQQAREEDIDRVRASYAKLGVVAEIASFFSDLPARMAAAHLVISRAGASTVAELAAIGRPAILVPLPHALDQDQLANASVLFEAGGAIVLKQQDFTPDRLARELAGFADDPDRGARMASCVRSVGVVDAANRLADLVLRVGGIVEGNNKDEIAS
jgi:UDP-N-acetylglucosamine--N-acetylmuramyl-(pentapeptide) pyrophosphoryl-undecaprenol N-acetylglucosamine transferase